MAEDLSEKVVKYKGERSKVRAAVEKAFEGSTVLPYFLAEIDSAPETMKNIDVEAKYVPNRHAHLGNKVIQTYISVQVYDASEVLS